MKPQEQTLKVALHKRLFVWLGCLATVAISTLACDPESAEDVPDIEQQVALDAASLEGIEMIAAAPTEVTDNEDLSLLTTSEPLMQIKDVDESEQVGFPSDSLIIDSWCFRPFKLAVLTHFAGGWHMHAWYNFAPFQRAWLSDAPNDGQFVYYYGETTDGSNLAWFGPYFYDIPGTGVRGFRVWDTGTDFGTKTLRVNC
jgi:hypothetical protein